MTSRKRTRAQSAKPEEGKCRNGHPRTQWGTYVNPGTGYRQCAVCKVQTDRKYRARNREACNEASRRSYARRNGGS